MYKNSWYNNSRFMTEWLRLESISGLAYETRFRRYWLKRHVGRPGSQFIPQSELGEIAELYEVPELTITKEDLVALGAFDTGSLGCNAGDYTFSTWPVNIRGIKFDIEWDLTGGPPPPTTTNVAYFRMRSQLAGYGYNTVQSFPQTYGALVNGVVIDAGGISVANGRITLGTTLSISKYLAQAVNPFAGTFLAENLHFTERILTHNGTPVSLSGSEVQNAFRVGTVEINPATFNPASAYVVGLTVIGSFTFTVAPIKFNLIPMKWGDG